jgi:hypothetical protein
VAAGAWHRLPAGGWKLARGELIRKKADRPKRIIEETNHLKPRAGQSGLSDSGNLKAISSRSATPCNSREILRSHFIEPIWVPKIGLSANL